VREIEDWGAMKSAAKGDESARQSRADVAEHIALEASGLARLATANQFPLLAHLIDSVVLEAWREATESNPDSRADDASGASVDDS
jgi:hypothetical protein